MEMGIIVALGWWGVQTGDSVGMKIALGIAVPVIGFGFWGLVDFHRTGSIAEPLRLIQELVVSGLAAVAWYTAGQHTLGLMLGLLSIIYHTMVYTVGETLLKHRG